MAEIRGITINAAQELETERVEKSLIYSPSIPPPPPGLNLPFDAFPLIFHTIFPTPYHQTTALLFQGGPMGLISLVLIAGSIVLILFVVLSGVTSTTPLKKTYFLQADTSTFIGSGRPVSQWTYFYVCGTDNADCGKPVPALPIGYAWIGGTEGVPSGLVGSRAKDTTSKYYYYMWRFGWVFYLMGLIFDVFAFFASLLAPCSRLASYFSGAILFFAVFWFSLGAALMTAVFVKARNEFHGAGISASLGRYAFGFTWGAWAAMFLAVITLFLGGGLSGARDTPTTRRSFFRRQSHRKSKGSFVDENGHRVKEEYS